MGAIKASFIKDAHGILRRTGDGDLSVGLQDLDPRRAGIDEVDPRTALELLRAERPAGAENRIAVAILEAVARIGHKDPSEVAAGVRALENALGSLSDHRAPAVAPNPVLSKIEDLRALLMST